MAYSPEEENQMWENWSNSLVELEPSLAEEIVRRIVEDEQNNGEQALLL